MKNVNIVMLVVGLFGGFPALAQDKLSDQHINQACTSFSHIGAKIMEARQTGTSLKDVIDAIETQEASTQSVQKAMAIDAYAIPQFAQEAQRQKAISLFKTEVYEACKLDLKKR